MTDLLRQEPDLLRQEIVSHARTVVVKVGTRVLTRPDGTLDGDRISHLASQINEMLDLNRRVILVSSGAVGAGMSRLGLTTRPTNLAQLQAVAAVGQASLIETYDRIFHTHGRHAAQVLLTTDDFHHRDRYLNVRNTVISLMEFGAIPIVNENDTVAVDELMVTFGDNDRLAAMVANSVRDSLLIILSDVDGLHDGDPSLPGSRVIPTVVDIDQSVQGFVTDRKSSLSKGGMKSKLEAARIVTTAGENVIVASGREPNVLLRLLQGEPLGTLFIAQGKAISPWKRWIGFTAEPKGHLLVDDGACRAIVELGRSMLAIGIVETRGAYEKGDAVTILSPSGSEVARGITNYSSTETRQIAGMRSKQISQVLGHCPYDEVIHRDNMAVLTPR